MTRKLQVVLVRPVRVDEKERSLCGADCPQMYTSGDGIQSCLLFYTGLVKYNGRAIRANACLERAKEVT